MAAVDGGAGAIVIPIAVKAITTPLRTTSAIDLLRPILVPEMNRYSPATTKEASRVSAKGMLFHKAKPTRREPAPASGSSGRWTRASCAQCDQTATATSVATRHLVRRREHKINANTPASADQATLANRP